MSITLLQHGEMLALPFAKVVPVAAIHDSDLNAEYRRIGRARTTNTNIRGSVTGQKSSDRLLANPREHCNDDLQSNIVNDTTIIRLRDRA